MSDTTMKVFWTKLIHPVWDDQPVYLASTERGLCRITWPLESFGALEDWTARHMQGAALIEDGGKLEPCLVQLTEYLDGKRTAFQLPLDLRGTPFQVSVWESLCAIPYGQIRTYSEIAAAAGKPSAVRAVGAANGANPVPIVVPCHRVIGKNAALTGFRGGLRMKERLLRLEGFQAYDARGHARFRF